MAQINSAPISAGEALASLASTAHKAAPLEYSGDVTPLQAFGFLQSHEGALIDVRTAPEWQAGLPDMGACSGELLAISWKFAPDYALNPQFSQTVQAAAADKNIPLFFICRSGGRSLDAAAAMTAAGYRYCFNVQGGFESAEGWKAANLPWKQV